jgi:hypothetical protein
MKELSGTRTKWTIKHYDSEIHEKEKGTPLAIRNNREIVRECGVISRRTALSVVVPLLGGKNTDSA